MDESVYVIHYLTRKLIQSAAGSMPLEQGIVYLDLVERLALLSHNLPYHLFHTVDRYFLAPLGQTVFCNTLTILVSIIQKFKRTSLAI